jgi:hypothetical protein
MKDEPMDVLQRRADKDLTVVEKRVKSKSPKSETRE